MPPPITEARADAILEDLREFSHELDDPEAAAAYRLALEHYHQALVNDRY